MSATRRFPRRPISQSAIVAGTTLRRSYVAPKSLDEPQLGDIVDWGGHRWDVVGWQALTPPDEAGYCPRSLQLQRIEKPLGRKKIVTGWAGDRDVVLIARQVVLPGTPEAAAAPRPVDRG